MTTTEYIEEMRNKRGGLTKNKEEQAMCDICDNGTIDFINWSIGAKNRGVNKMAYIATSLSPEEQDKFVIWAKIKNRTAAEIDIYLLGVI